MISIRRQPLLQRVPAWLIILTVLMAASVIAERVQAASGSSDMDGTEHYPRISRQMTGRAVAFALTFDQIVSHSGSLLKLVTSTGSTRRIPIRLVAQPNTIYASIGGLEPGDYRLQWDAQAADGTRLLGSLPFNVGHDALGPPSLNRKRDEVTMGDHMMKYDAIVIGTGQAGPSLARRMAARGLQVAIIERGRFGGTCVNTGCTPTKALVASAYAAHLARRSAEYGIKISGPIGIDMKRVKARKDSIGGASSKAVEASLRAIENLTVIQGHARFASTHEVSVGDAGLSADRIFINVGGRPSVPSIPGLDGTRYLTSSSILDLDTVPRHLIVIGGSYVGLEFAQMYRRFGSEVTVIEAAQRLIGREDPEISDAVHGILRAENIAVHVGARTVGVEQGGNGITAIVEDTAGRHTMEASHLLIAVGRRPNTDDLGLDSAGITVDRHGFIMVNDMLRTNVESIWALGECNGRGAFTHTAYNDFEIVAANLLDGETRSVADRISAYALFTDPPLGRVGMTEAEARASGNKILVGELPMEDVSRAYEKGETLGLMKIVVDSDTKAILGAAILGTSGDEAVHCVLDLMYAKAPSTLLQRAMHIHPTVSEFIPTLLDGLTAR